MSAALFLLLSAGAAAQSSGTYNSYTPYSTFGLGDLTAPGSAYNKAMGGVGIATRNHKYINTLNPASITERDSLSVMADLSLFYTYKLFQQDKYFNNSNLFNIGSFAVTLPIYHSLTAIVGLAPFSSSGYFYSADEQDPELVGRLGNINYSSTGQGNIYQVYGGLAFTLFDRVSLGAQYLFLFGNTNNTYTQTFALEAYRGLGYSFNKYITAHTGKFGIQYEQPIGKNFKLCLGGTYRIKANLNGSTEMHLYSLNEASGLVDSDEYDLRQTNPRVNIASEMGVGVSLNYIDQFRAEFNYTRSNWTASQLDKVEGFSLTTTDGTVFTNTVSQSFRLGMELTPNRNDIRYYLKRATYRLGAYYNTEYYKVAGNDITSMGICLGATLPIFRWYNGCTIAVDLGRRGSVKNNLILERYVTVSVGFNLFDIWFRKPKYE